MDQNPNRFAATADAPRTERARLVALAGNPNVGKTTLFNQLTGLRQKVGNYPGVTVERKIGRFVGEDGKTVQIVDVPGTYSLNPRSLDEEIAYRVLVGGIEGQRRPDLIVCVTDASNLERNLYLASQVIDLGLPMVIALNMTDAAAAEGLQVDVDTLSEQLQVPIIPLAASRGHGVDELKKVLAGELPEIPKRQWVMPAAMEQAVEQLAAHLSEDVPSLPRRMHFADALRAMVNSTASTYESHHSDLFWRRVEDVRRDLRERGVLYEQAEIVARYDWITPLAHRVLRRTHGDSRRNVSERLDAVLTHRIAGPLAFLGILAVVFQAVFSWAAPVMDLIDSGVGALGDVLSNSLPAGILRDLLIDGAIAGVGGIVIFLPQILFLFFFLGLLEDTGYMARVAFIMDRLMKKVGLSGRSVVPLLSAYACAIPGIMATRTMDSQRDRLVTIMVTPFMTCSARLPVYALVIAAFIPSGGFFLLGYQAITLLTLYLLGTGTAILMAYLLKRHLIKGEESMFVMELPPYRRPRMRDVLYRMFERGKLFLSRAGTIILAISIVLWFLASFPKLGPTDGLQSERALAEAAHAIELNGIDQLVLNAEERQDRIEALEIAHAEQLAEFDGNEAALALRNSFIGRAGHAIEPIIRPLGFDWKIGVAVLTSFAAREVVVSALATIYSVGDADESDSSLHQRMLSDTDPDTGEKVWSSLVGMSLLVFFVFACQCMATLAVVRRETNSWRWPLFMWVYMAGLAYLASLLVYQGGLLLGLG